MDELMVAVAPVPGEKQEEKFPGKLDAAEETIRSWNAGACLTHLHVRDSNLLQTTDTTLFQEDLWKIRKATDIIIEGSTGGAPEHTLADRCVSFNVPEVEMGTLNLGSINMYDGVYSNCESDIYFYARKLKEKRIIPSLLCFDLSHFYMPKRLEDDGLLDPAIPPTYALIFDTPNCLPFSEENLDIFLSRLPKNAVWFLILHHAMGANAFKAAIDRGGHVRVGYEDGPFLANRTRAGTNAPLVEEVVRYARACGREIASPSRAREMMAIPQLH